MRATILLLVAVVGTTVQAGKLRGFRRRLILEKPVQNLTAAQKEYFVRLMWLVQHANKTGTGIKHDDGDVIEEKFAQGGFSYDAKNKGLSNEPNGDKGHESHISQYTHSLHHASQKDESERINKFEISGKQGGQSRNNVNQIEEWPRSREAPESVESISQSTNHVHGEKEQPLSKEINLIQSPKNNQSGDSSSQSKSIEFLGSYVEQGGENYGQNNKNANPSAQSQESAENNTQNKKNKIQSLYSIHSKKNKIKSNTNVNREPELVQSGENNNQSNDKSNQSRLLQSAENNGKSNNDPPSAESQGTTEDKAQYKKNDTQSLYVIQSAESKMLSYINEKREPKIVQSEESKSQSNDNSDQSPFLIQRTATNDQYNNNVNPSTESHESAEKKIQSNSNENGELELVQSLEGNGQTKNYPNQSPFLVQRLKNNYEYNSHVNPTAESQESVETNAQYIQNRIQIPYGIQNKENYIQSNKNDYQEPESLQSVESNADSNNNSNESPDIQQSMTKGNQSNNDLDSNVEQPQSDENNRKIQQSSETERKAKHEDHRYQYGKRHPQRPRSSSRLPLYIIKSDQSLQTFRIIPAPRLTSLVVKLCENSNKNIMAVWKRVAKYFGLNNDYTITNIYEVEKLFNIMRAFVVLSRKEHFTQMPLSMILAAISDKIINPQTVGKSTENQNNGDENNEDIDSFLRKYSEENGLKTAVDSPEFWLETSLDQVPGSVNSDETLEVQSDSQESVESNAEATKTPCPNIDLITKEDGDIYESLFHFLLYIMKNNGISPDSSVSENFSSISDDPGVNRDKLQPYVLNPKIDESGELKELRSSVASSTDSSSSDAISNERSIPDDPNVDYAKIPLYSHYSNLNDDLMPVSPSSHIRTGKQHEELSLETQDENSAADSSHLWPNSDDDTVSILPASPNLDISSRDQRVKLSSANFDESSDITSSSDINSVSAHIDDDNLEVLPVSPDPNITSADNHKEMHASIADEKNSDISADSISLDEVPGSASADIAIKENSDFEDLDSRSAQIQPSSPNPDVISELPPPHYSDIEPELPNPDINSSDLPFDLIPHENQPEDDDSDSLISYSISQDSFSSTPSYPVSTGVPPISLEEKESTDSYNSSIEGIEKTPYIIGKNVSKYILSLVSNVSPHQYTQCRNPAYNKLLDELKGIVQQLQNTECF